MSSAAPSLTSLVSGKKPVVKASSTLNRSVEYAPASMFDGKEDTCWNSDTGSAQWLTLNFKRTVVVHTLDFVFQGGFVGQDCQVSVSEDGKIFTPLVSIHPADSNDLQISGVPPTPTFALRMDFNRSSDLYGRVIIYSLDVKGSESP